MYLAGALFPKPTLLVTARGGTVFWSGFFWFCFVFPNTGNHDRDKKQTRFPRTTFGAVQPFTSYCAV